MGDILNDFVLEFVLAAICFVDLLLNFLIGPWLIVSRVLVLERATIYSVDLNFVTGVFDNIGDFVKIL